MRFCPDCGTLLTFDNKGSFLCKTCNREYAMMSNDTLLANYSKPKETDKYEALIRSAYADPALKKIDKKCSKCNEYLGILLVGDDEHVIEICKCKN